MNGFWLINTVVLWILILGAGLVILVLARELAVLQVRLDNVEQRLRIKDRYTDKAGNSGNAQIAEGD